MFGLCVRVEKLQVYALVDSRGYEILLFLLFDVDVSVCWKNRNFVCRLLMLVFFFFLWISASLTCVFAGSFIVAGLGLRRN